MNIEIKPRNPIKEFFQNLYNKSEDILFSTLTHIPESLIPPILMNWIDIYTTKRTQQLQQEIIHQQWQQIYLEKAVEEIHTKQDKKEAQTEN